MFIFEQKINKLKKSRYLAIWKRVSQSNPYMALRDNINKEIQKWKCIERRQHTSEDINRVMISAALSNQVLTL